MTAMDAVQVAKDYVRTIYRDEKIKELGLEELEQLEGEQDVWCVTIGFRRGWQEPDAPGEAPAEVPEIFRFTAGDHPELRRRTYKTVRIRDDGKVLSMRHRDVPEAI